MTARTLARPLVMAILNVTPDSFYDGGRLTTEDAAIARAQQLIREGADIVDVGAESTRPGAEPIANDEQIRRIGRVIPAIVAKGARASIDTTSPVVARHALEQGASMINSVSLEVAADLARLAVETSADLVLMHSRGAMKTMAGFSAYPESGYRDVVRDVRDEWLPAAEAALATGLPRERIYFDPGLGFQKSARQSIELLRELGTFADMGFPIAVGPSRKSFIAKIARDPVFRGAGGGDGEPEAGPDDRLGGTLAATLAAVDRGAALVRVHDVVPVRQALAIRAAITSSSVSGGEVRSAAASRAERGAA